MTSVVIDDLDGVRSSKAFKTPCRVATTANITLSGEQTIDGVAVVADDRVLVKEQSAGADNGVYVASAGTWTRAPDFDGTRDVTSGTKVFVTSGSTNGRKEFYIQTADPITIGTTSLTFGQSEAQVGGPYLPSAGGTLTGDVTLGTNAQILLDDSITAAGANLPLAFDGDTDLGMYRKSANTGALAANSADVLSWGTSGVDITGGLTTTGSINTINGLSGFILQKDGSNNPLIAFDSTDYLGYDRTGNQHLAVIGSTEASATTLARGVLAKNTPSMAVSVADVAGTPTVQRSVNVSSITDNGVGDFTVNLTTAIGSAEAALLCGNMRYSGLNSGIPVVTGRNIDRTQTTTAIQVATWSGGTNDARDASRWAVATIDGA